MLTPVNDGRQQAAAIVCFVVFMAVLGDSWQAVLVSIRLETPRNLWRRRRSPIAIWLQNSTCESPAGDEQYGNRQYS